MGPFCERGEGGARVNVGLHGYMEEYFEGCNEILPGCSQGWCAMTQNRQPPAYQEYAATMLANMTYRLMSLAERGLMDTIRRECWVNGGLPANPGPLAKVLHCDQAEVEAALPAVMSFFAVECGLIVCPELEHYRNHLAEARERQAAGGRRSANKRKAEQGKADCGDSASTLQAPSKQPASTLQGRRQVKTKPNQSKTVAIKEILPCSAYEEWMDPKQGCSSDEYARASGGE